MIRSSQASDNRRGKGPQPRDINRDLWITTDLKSFQRNPAFVVDIVQHINWFKQYFELEFTLHEKNGKARFNLFNEDGF